MAPRSIETPVYVSLPKKEAAPGSACTVAVATEDDLRAQGKLDYSEDGLSRCGHIFSHMGTLPPMCK